MNGIAPLPSALKEIALRITQNYYEQKSTGLPARNTRGERSAETDPNVVRHPNKKGPDRMIRAFPCQVYPSECRSIPLGLHLEGNYGL